MPPGARLAKVVREERCGGGGAAAGPCRCAKAHRRALWSFVKAACPGDACDFVGLSVEGRRKLHETVGVILKTSKAPLKLLHKSDAFGAADTRLRLRVVMQPCRRGWDNYYR